MEGNTRRLLAATVWLNTFCIAVVCLDLFHGENANDGSQDPRSLSKFTRYARSPKPIPVCRLCRGKPRKCKCYKYKKVGKRYKCSYSQKVECEVQDKNVNTSETFLLNNTFIGNKTEEEICGFSGKYKPAKTPRSFSSRQGRIINGTKSAFGAWPWQVSLRQWNRLKGSYLHKCGATLIGKEWAITAAHCVHSQDRSKLLLIMGEHDIYNDREPFAMEGRKLRQVLVHPDFDPSSFENDLALLQMASPVSYQANILPACLPQKGEYKRGTTGWVTGWGRMKIGGPLASVLQELEVPLITNRQCERMYLLSGHPQYIPYIFLCAGYQEGGRDSCDGDSGGPLSVQRKDGRFELAGVVSWGIGCAEKNQPGVMARVAEYQDWIQKTVNDS